MRKKKPSQAEKLYRKTTDKISAQIDDAGNFVPTREPVGKKPPPVFYDAASGKFWLLQRGEYQKLDKASIKLQFQLQGVLANQETRNGLALWERAIAEGQRDRQVDYAGPLAGYQAGPITVAGGRRLLVTKGFDLIESDATVGFQFLGKYLVALLGPMQITYFLLWLKFARKALVDRTFAPGQFLVLCGPAASGKSFCQWLITQALTGRQADPWQFMIGDTRWNDDLCQAEHLAIEDKAGSFDMRARLAFGAAIKDLAAVEQTMVRARFMSACQFSIFKRASASVNDGAEQLIWFPPLAEHLTDKLMMFHCTEAAKKVLFEDRKKNQRLALKELPGLLAHVDELEVPDGMKDRRYGVKAFIHPYISEILTAASPENRLDELITDAIFAPRKLVIWEGSSEKLKQELMQSDYRFSVEGLLRFPGACGTFLARLAKHEPGRFASRMQEGRKIWTIQARPKEGLL